MPNLFATVNQTQSLYECQGSILPIEPHPFLRQVLTMLPGPTLNFFFAFVFVFFNTGFLSSYGASPGT
ncbi:hypothetical protein ACQP3D_29710, partial [Escherichia coli]